MKDEESLPAPGTQEPGATSKGKASVPAKAVSPKADTPISQITKGSEHFVISSDNEQVAGVQLEELPIPKMQRLRFDDDFKKMRLV